MSTVMVFHISESRIRFLQAGQAGKKIILADALVTEGLNEDQTIQRLKDFVKHRQLKFRGARVIVAIGRHRAILRRMNLPSHNEDELRSMADLQVAGHIPYAREEVEMDFQVLRKSPDGYAQVMAVVIPKEVARGCWKIFSGAHIPVNAMTISSVGLWQLCRQQAGLRAQLAAVIDVDLDHSEICFCYKEFWLTAREIPVGLKQLRQNGTAEFLRQWDVSCAHLANEKAAEAVSALFLTGQAGQTPLNSELAQKQGFAPVLIDIDKKAVKSSEPVSWAASLGLALSPGLPPINLIPQEIKEQKLQGTYRREFMAFGAWLGAAAVTLALALGMGGITKNMQLRDLKKKLESAKEGSVLVEDQLRKVREIEEMFKTRPLFSEWIKALTQILPSQVSLFNIALNENTLTVQGVSTSSADISQLQRTMVTSPLFANVNLDYVNKRVTQEGEVNYFKITCALKLDKEADDKAQ